MKENKVTINSQAWEDTLRKAKEIENMRTTKGLVSPNVIPTMYKGIQFRSRLEARWAVFFDTLGIEWEYEPQGYAIGLSNHNPENPETIYTFSDGTTECGDWHKIRKEKMGITVVAERLSDGSEDVEWYLPDFWLPELKIWAEVKGVFGDDELLTTVRAIDGFSMGLPNIHDYDKNNPSGILYLGDIPNPGRNKGTGSHIIFTRRKGVENRVARFRFNSTLEKVELEVGAVYDGFWYLDIICMYDPSVIHYYSNPENYKKVVKGLPRNYGQREGITGMWPSSAHRGALLLQSPNKYLSTDVDWFGEKVLEAGWAEARNYQF